MNLAAKVRCFKEEEGVQIYQALFEGSACACCKNERLQIWITAMISMNLAVIFLLLN